MEDYRVEAFKKILKDVNIHGRTKVTEESLLKCLLYKPQIQSNADYIHLQNLRQKVIDVRAIIDDSLSSAGFFRDSYKHRHDIAVSLVIKNIKDEIGATLAGKVALSTEIELNGSQISPPKEKNFVLAFSYWCGRFSEQEKHLERIIVSIKDDITIAKERIAKGLE